MNYLLHLLYILLTNCLVFRICKLLSQLFLEELSKSICWFLQEKVHSAGQGTFVSQHSWHLSFINCLSLLYIRGIEQESILWSLVLLSYGSKQGLLSSKNLDSWWGHLGKVAQATRMSQHLSTNRLSQNSGQIWSNIHHLLSDKLLQIFFVFKMLDGIVGKVLNLLLINVS